MQSAHGAGESGGFILTLHLGGFLDQDHQPFDDGPPYLSQIPLMDSNLLVRHTGDTIMASQSHIREEQKLLALIRQGDQGAFKTIYYRYFTSLAAVAGHIASNSAEAEDAAQAALMTLWNKREEVAVEVSLAGYLKQIAVREALAQKRKEQHRRDLLRDRPDIGNPCTSEDPLTEYRELRSRVNEAVDQLPEKCGEVFRLSRFEGMSYKEISEALDISTKTVEHHMGKALRQLRVALREFISIFL